MKLDSDFVFSHLLGMTTFKDSSEHKRWNHVALSALITHSPLQTALWPLKMCTFSLAPSAGFKERKGWTRAVAIESGSLPEGEDGFPWRMNLTFPAVSPAQTEGHCPCPGAAGQSQSFFPELEGWCCQQPHMWHQEQWGSAPSCRRNSTLLLICNHSQSGSCFFSCLWAGCDRKSSAVQSPGKNCRQTSWSRSVL